MHTFVALCAIGAERILGNEIKLLGYTVNGNAPGRVIFSGDDDALIRANLCLRTADRVYLQLALYKAQTFDELFAGTYEVAWETFFKKNVRVVVDKVRSHGSTLTSEHSIQSIVHKAIYTRLGDRWHMATVPETGATATVRVYIWENDVQVLLDTSGAALHKRGYRSDGGPAPLRETVAAVLLQELLWRRKIPLHDPFCGAGTIVLEALLYAHNVAPGLARHFAFEQFAFYDAHRMETLRRSEAEKIRTDVRVRISGSDIDQAAVMRAKKNAEAACTVVHNALAAIGSCARVALPDFSVADMATLAAPYECGVIVCNPPYGERLGDEAAAQELYKKMGALWNNFSGWDFGIITANKKFQNCFGHYATKLKDITAGNLNTRLYIYHRDRASSRD
ncbi:MAG: class I SAM-dependent RNA methyltransferase [Treponema sp.]|nr:class I SAM-dependent RNA methyltransferase [Treponema sp.]